MSNKKKRPVYALVLDVLAEHCTTLDDAYYVLRRAETEIRDRHKGYRKSIDGDELAGVLRAKPIKNPRMIYAEK